MSSRLEGDAFLKNIASQNDSPLTHEEWEQSAEQKMKAHEFGHIRSGAGAEETLRRNRSAFSKWAILPRMLNDVSSIDTSITLFGHKYAHPFLLAPIGMQRLAHEDGDLASVRAAAKWDVPFIASTVSSYSLEDIAEAAGTNPRWFQLYWSNNEAVSYNMLKRAEQAGYEAIVVTVDTVMLGWREEDLRNNFSPLREGIGKANYLNDRVFMESLTDTSDEGIIQGILENIHHPSFDWKKIEDIKRATTLPVLLKGILHPDDAILAVEAGIDGIIVSNHGGRQLDGVAASLDALPLIAEAVNGRIPLLLDSGIRRGTDLVKALALGADAVLLGRPYIYGLAVAGQAGVEQVLENFIEETRVSLALAGIPDISKFASIKLIRE
ncbi:alpha-hydroxy acid oxidase [Planococcus shenhongbingii]|uniref:L-lactate oxidase n=1 Tax=Planococcus shenhongbingii TaxID=3058398 RepID=A0ABT8NF48_9BACL|nr:alpha-hydroxy acid oxidase [Planococcus sp. N017]MDN7246334.1 alpha-hydroxy acid oxidase [Planococcus sp. N017]